MKLQHFAMSCLFLLIAAGLYLTLKSDMEATHEEQRAVNQAIIKGQQDQQAVNQALLKKITDNAAPGEAAGNPAVVSTPAVAVAAVPSATGAPVKPTGIAKTPSSTSPDKPAAAVPGTIAAADPAEPPALDAALTRDAQELLASAQDQVTTADPPAGSEERPLTRLQESISRQGAIAKIEDARTGGTDFVVINAGTNANITAGSTFAVRRGTAIVGRVVINDNIQKDQAVADVKKLVPGMVLQEGDELIIFDEQQR